MACFTLVYCINKGVVKWNSEKNYPAQRPAERD